MKIWMSGENKEWSTLKSKHVCVAGHRHLFDLRDAMVANGWVVVVVVVGGVGGPNLPQFLY